MARRFIRSAAVTGAAAVVLGMSPGAPTAWADPPDTCDGQSVTILGTDGNDDLTGTSGDDVVSLGMGDDRFDGRGGADVVCGGAGHDILQGDRGDDRLLGEDDADLVIGGRGNDLVDGGSESDTIYGDQLGGKTLPGWDGADTVLGGAGDDYISLVAGDGFGGGGADTADGGDGVDLVTYETSPVGVRMNVADGVARADAVDHLTGFESYRGSNRSDTIVGSDGPDILDGLEAWGGHDDRILGRDGADTITADQGTIDAGPGKDTYLPSGRGSLGLDIRLGYGRDTADVMQGDDTTIHGGPGDDSLLQVTPDYGRMRIDFDGGAGADLLSFASFGLGAVQVDLAHGTATARKLHEGVADVEHVTGTGYDDILSGGPSADVLAGLGGADRLLGRRGPDQLFGGDGPDIADGGRGRDLCQAEVRRSCQSVA